ncbi:MAG TPA: glycosyltransferase family A protein [Bacteroidales bacterium]|jgi:hypothetical protein|nr:glycosyltransferase family A protein [Bacteroidales bacterium]
MKPLTIFLPLSAPEILEKNLNEFNSSGLINKIFVLVPRNSSPPIPEGIHTLEIDTLYSSDTVRKIATHAVTAYALLYIKEQPLSIGPSSLHRMIQVAENTKSAMIYSDYYSVKDNQTYPSPVIDYQQGSLRDDFNFGPLLFYDTSALRESASAMQKDYIYAGIYDLRLKLSQKYQIFHLPEFLYTETETDTRKSGEKQFDYVNPRNREVQIEMEKACTDFLKETGAWLEPHFRDVNFNEMDFNTEVSVIIPVKNRVNTISDAIRSVLSQNTSFTFNLIIADNHSNDGTTEEIRKFSNDKRVVHIIPTRTDLGIGGCWNEAILNETCGKFAVQLDSDDLYIDENVLERIAAALYEQKCAMIVGTYRMVNFNLEELPPGIIDHREWTPDNGRNNALRINGLGAPRAFYTPVIRSIRFPNVSYGEDYAVGLNISRFYRIGRIYDPLYLCRRWEGNSDAALDIQKLNTYNFYKDKIRTIEYYARQNYIKNGQT